MVNVLQEFAFKLAAKIRVSSHRDNVPSRDHVIAVCNKFDLIFIGINNGKLLTPSMETETRIESSLYFS